MTTRSSLRTKSHTRPKVTFFGRMLVPIDQLGEVIFAVLILLAFTQAYRLLLSDYISAEFVSREYASELLWTSLGAIFAWSTIDGLMYVLLSALGRSERHQLLYTIQAAETDQEAVDAIAEEFDYMLEPIAEEERRQSLYTGMLEDLRASRPRQVGVKKSDWIEALSIVVVAVVSVLPSLAPLVLLRDNLPLALRVSNVISLSILFVAGYLWGKYTGASPWKTGLLLASVGAFMLLGFFLLGG